MRKTKALLCAAAVAAGGLTAMAQTSNVYSLNVVGYVNFYLTEGFNLVANHMDADGTGTNNTIVGVVSNQLPVNSAVYVYNGVGYNQATYAKNKAGTATNWSANYPMNPGAGAWISIPTGALGGGTQACVTVGNVLTGALINPDIPGGGGLGFLGNMLPIAGGLTSNLNYQPQLNDKVYLYNGAGYNQFTYAKNKAGTATNWAPSEPFINVGQGLWLSTGAGSTWSNYFQVQ